MRAFSESTLAAAHREIRRCQEALRKATKDGSPQAWLLVGLALTHIEQADGMVECVFEMEEQNHE